MAKHTRGPWRISEDDRFGCEVVSSSGTICFVLDDKQDARLIVAAPEMLSALQQAKLQIEYLHEKFRETGSGNAVLAGITAIIKQAEGE